MFGSARSVVLGFLAALVAALVGCGSSREAGPPRLTRSVNLPLRMEQFAAGSRGRMFCASSPRRMMGGGQSALQMVEPSGSPGDEMKLATGVEVKAVAADGRGTLYLGVREGGKDQVWVMSEETSGEKAMPRKLTYELPGDLRGVFLGREPGILYALYGDNGVAKLRTDGSVLQKVELPGDSRPEQGGVDKEGNVYIRRSSGPVVKIKPDGTIDKEWAKSAAAGHDSVQALAVDSRGIVYIAASDGDIRLRGYDAKGVLAFNVVAEALDRTPEQLALGRDDTLYALLGPKLLVFRP